MEKLKKTPLLRFPEFEVEWKFEPLENYIELYSGIALKGHEITDDESGTPILRGINITEGFIRHTTEIDKFYLGNTSKLEKYLVKENDIVLGMDGSKVGKNVALIKKEDENSILIQRVARIRSNDKSDIKYIYQQIFSKKFRDYVDVVNTSSGIPHISSQQIKDFKVGFSSLAEQTKIATFLTAVDEKLTTLKQKKTLLEQYKKGGMQKIFSQELRFKDDNRNEYPDWEEKKLGDCLDYIQPTKYLVSNTEYDNSYSTPVLTAGKTFILGYTNETNGIFENNLPVIIFDDFTTATQFVDFPFKAKSSAMKILIAKEGINIKFIYEAMQVMNYEVGGHERHWISKFAPLEILIPSTEEQIKIANFLSAIDEKINHCQSQIEKTEVWKKGLLQQMFV